MTKVLNSGGIARSRGEFWPDAASPSTGLGLRPGMFGQRAFRVNQIPDAARRLLSAQAGTIPFTVPGNAGSLVGLTPSLDDRFSRPAPSEGPSTGDVFSYTDPLKTCYGFARGLAGNTRLYGKMGAFDIVQPNTAAIIPYQFDQSRKAALAPYVKRISGQLTSRDGKRSSWFRGITDVIDGTSPIPGVPVRDALQRLSPGQLIIEVPGGQDVGKAAPVVLRNYPSGLRCPAGTGL